MRRARGLTAALTVLALVSGDVGGAANARADDAADGREKSMCSTKYQSAQRLRAGGKLTLARADLLRCAEPACPAFVSKDCKTWLAEVETDLPTLVFAVLDANGGDVPNAVVRVDGVDVPRATDGLGHALDPGMRVVEASAQGQSVREQVVVRVGEKSRRVELRLALGGARTAPTVPAESPRAESSHPPIGAYLLGGVSALGIVTGSILWVTGSNAAKAYNAQCESTGCSASQHDDVQRQLVAGDIAWGLGLAAGLGAVAVLLTRTGRGGSASLSLGPSGVRWAGTF